MPFGEYKDFKDCVEKNKDKKDPEAYCAKIKEQIEGSQYMDDGEINVSAQMKIQVSASDDDNSFTIAAAKVGSKSFAADGTKYIFTEEALRSCAESWVGGKITLNHDIDDIGSITAAWYDEDTQLLMQKISCDNPETVKRVKAGEPTGVSIEASVLDIDDDNNVLAFNGTGVGIMFYPVQPACPLKDGCGIRASEQESIIDDDIQTTGGTSMVDELETISKVEYDKVLAKNAELSKEIESLKTDDAIKAKDVEIEAKDVKISELTAEIDRRDSEISASLVEEIKALDAEFEPSEGMALSTIQTIHASLSRAMKKDETEVAASEQEKEEVDEEFVKAGEFNAPANPARKSGMTVGGIRNGIWTRD